ncbi:TolC family protein [Salinicola peritrichatus]|uniref:TolC family protein n=1 Tax=Salinicola peritrichatus TaxID=1267424 RepID=UPI001EF762F1|nr:TolC family protein [Salinicola peritrichatus]
MDARQQFRVLVGVPAEGLDAPHPSDLTWRLADGGALDDWIIAAPGYRQALASAEQAQAELDETQASLKPQLNLEGSLQRRQIGGELENDSVIGFRLRMDTLQGLANFQRPDAARQRLEAARYRIDDQRREIRRSVLTLIENAEVYGDRQRALEDQIEQSRTVSRLYDDQFSVGLRDVNDLLTIRQEAYTAQRQLIDLESQQKRIQYRAASQLGLMNPLVSGRLGE